MSDAHYQLLIIGGGAAGISVAANLRRKNRAIGIAIIEPSDVHYYQPAFTLVGGGEYRLEDTRRREADLIPPKVSWIEDHAEGIDPDQRRVTLRSGDQVGYDHLVVCPGLQLDWHRIAGLNETLGTNGVCSNYSPNYASYTWECIRRFSGGTALFTQPPAAIKCAGAPQKIMYLAADRWRVSGLPKSADIRFLNAAGAMFSVPLFAKELEKVAARYGVKLHLNCNLVAVDGQARTATFEQALGEGNKETLTLRFEMIHVTPPQSAPNFIKRSPLTNAAGWVDVNENTLQHTKYPNVFSLGDASSAPTSKTAAAVRKQVPVVVNNLLAAMAGKPLDGRYDGYTSCPLTTSLHAVMLAEFVYGGKVTPSFPLDPRAERRLWWYAKKYGLPHLYWDFMLKGLDWDIPHREAYMNRFLAV